MGEEYKKLLCEWGLESLIDRFEDEEINDEVFFLLTDDLIKELIPKIGPRAKFAAKYHAYEYDASNPFPLLPRNQTSCGAHTLLPEERAETYSTFSVEIHPSGPEDQNDERSSVPSAGPNNQCGDWSQATAGPSTQYAHRFSNLDPILETSHIFRKRPSEFTVRHSRLPDTESGGTEPHELPDVATGLDLKALLERSRNGRLILASYEKEGLLDKASRQSLVTVVIEECLEHTTKLVNNQLHLIAKKIVSLFPNEHEGTYYLPPFRDGSSQRISKGKLVDKYRGKKRKLICAGLPRERKFKRRKAIPNDLASPLSESSSLIPEELQDHVAWLRLNTEPWPEVILHWTATSALRVGAEAEDTGVEDIFDSWPALTQPLGYDLIDIDFEFLYPSQKLVLFWKWPEVVGTLTSIMRGQITGKASTDLMKLLVGPNLNPDSELVITLMLLAALCPPVTKLRFGCSKSWKPSILESQEGMVVHVKFARDIGPLLQVKREKAASMNLTLQPMLIVQGASLNRLEAFYVSINQQLYCLPSMLKALDICFKTYQVFNATYPPESEQLWMFVQKYIYGITTKYDKQISSVYNLITRIELKQSQTAP